MSGYDVVESVFLRNVANAKGPSKRSPRRAHLSHQIKAENKDRILTINDVKVDRKARFGNLTSPLSQDHAFNSTTSNPLAAVEAERAAADNCPKMKNEAM